MTSDNSTIDTSLRSEADKFDNVIRSLVDQTTADLNREKDALENARAILMATDKGDASENAPLQIARDEVSMRTAMVTRYLKRVESMESDIGNYTPNGFIALGSTIEVTMIGVPEGISQLRGKQLIIKLVKHDTGKAALGLVAIDTKLGTAILGRVAGDDVEVMAPAGAITYHIERVY